MSVHWEFQPCPSLCSTCHRALERLKTSLSAGYFLAEFYSRLLQRITVTPFFPTSLVSLECVFWADTSVLFDLFLLLSSWANAVDKNISLSIPCSVLSLMTHPGPLSLPLCHAHPHLLFRGCSIVQNSPESFTYSTWKVISNINKRNRNEDEPLRDQR